MGIFLSKKRTHFPNFFFSTVLNHCTKSKFLLIWLGMPKNKNLNFTKNKIKNTSRLENVNLRLINIS